MNNGLLYRWLQGLSGVRLGSGLAGIALVFILLMAALAYSLDRYWHHTLQPRLYQTAETQAEILARAQSAVLLESLQYTAPEQRQQRLFDVIQEMLIVTDPAIGERMILAVSLEVDYDLIEASPGSLDFNEGAPSCGSCFQMPVALIANNGDLLGVAGFSVSDRYFSVLASDMRSQLMVQSGVLLLLLILVWGLMSFMFHRLNQAKQVIEASDRAKTRFLASVTHELRTPLNSILGYTQIFREDRQLMESRGQGVESISRSADHLLHMINDILDFARADEESLSLHPNETNLPELLTALAEMSRIRVATAQVKFICDFPAALPSSVLVDDKRLRQVLLNLLSNAVKFTETGSVVFSAAVLHNEDGYISIRFGVKDSGIGIEERELKNIFIPFHQLDNRITQAEGSGLGLTISQKILRLMNSELKVRSSPGEGSEFWFVLRLMVTEQRQTELQEAEPDAQILTLPARDVLQKLHDEASRHDILALRATLASVEEDENLQPFVAEVRRYTEQYRFQPLAAWLLTVAD
ncbi:HAMP domain-containing sensor histidine kinase [uncultured Thalassolituus sp.]|uniref:sensor histidine kinase n=1 Tax=uncultured Thalassolituus sp. TaxID=285273 RepID=UPI002632AC5B|nr:HAMP domain-containing sensor histidine kinase [uncultured Thalassolituus sp.]